MREAGSWRQNLFAATAAGFIGFTGFTLVMPFLPLYFHELGLRDVGEIALWSGLSLGVTPALTAALSPLWGRLADRFGRKIMVERSLASFVIVMSAMAYVREPWHVFALRAVQGLFAGYGALTLTMAAESAPPGKTAAAIGFVQTAQRLGPALGPVIGGVVAQLVGIRNAFFVSACFYAVALVLVFVLYHEQPPASRASSGPKGPVRFRDLIAFEHFLLLMLVVFLVQLVDRSFGPILPLFLGQIGVAPGRVPLVAGVLFSEAAFAAALGHHVTGRLLQRAPARTLLVGATSAAAAGALAYAVAPPAELLFVVTPLFGIAVGVAMTTAYSSAGRMIPAGAGGAGFGLLTTASLTALAVSPMLSGALGATSIRAVFAIDGAVMVVLAGVVWRVMRGSGAPGAPGAALQSPPAAPRSSPPRPAPRAGVAMGT
ncbi:MAG: MFS transporter [Acidobacteria bacterium]|nr:MFS transporter [Acidobacteriota bacterium]